MTPREADCLISSNVSVQLTLNGDTATVLLTRRDRRSLYGYYVRDGRIDLTHEFKIPRDETKIIRQVA